MIQQSTFVYIFQYCCCFVTGDKMDDYAKARYKSNKRLTVMKLTTPTGGMNPDMSLVDFIQDGDLNKSLKHFVSDYFTLFLLFFI